MKHCCSREATALSSRDLMSKSSSLQTLPCCLACSSSSPSLPERRPDKEQQQCFSKIAHAIKKLVLLEMIAPSHLCFSLETRTEMTTSCLAHNKCTSKQSGESSSDTPLLLHLYATRLDASKQNLRRLREEYANADRDFLDAVVGTLRHFVCVHNVLSEGAALQDWHESVCLADSFAPW